MFLISYYLKRIKEECMKSLHIVRFYNSRFGLKNVGAGYLLGAKNYSSVVIKNISADSLFLGPDYLKDKYTLLNCPISQSPHYGFIKTIMENGDMASTDYIQRFVSGKLDWRRGSKKPRDFNYFKKMFSRSLGEIQSGDYSPIIIYSLGGKYYIYDGKHRAALCSLLGVPVKCMLVGSEIANADLWHFMFSIIKDNEEYGRHTEYHNLYLRELTGYGKE